MRGNSRTRNRRGARGRPAGRASAGERDLRPDNRAFGGAFRRQAWRSAGRGGGAGDGGAHAEDGVAADVARGARLDQALGRDRQAGVTELRGWNFGWKGHRTARSGPGFAQHPPLEPIRSSDRSENPTDESSVLAGCSRATRRRLPRSSSTRAKQSPSPDEARRPGSFARAGRRDHERLRRDRRHGRARRQTRDACRRSVAMPDAPPSRGKRPCSVSTFLQPRRPRPRIGVPVRGQRHANSML